MLVRRQALAAVDDMAVLRGALIDDCALARALFTGFGVLPDQEIRQSSSVVLSIFLLR